MCVCVCVCVGVFVCVCVCANVCVCVSICVFVYMYGIASAADIIASARLAMETGMETGSAPKNRKTGSLCGVCPWFPNGSSTVPFGVP